MSADVFGELVGERPRDCCRQPADRWRLITDGWGRLGVGVYSKSNVLARILNATRAADPPCCIHTPPQEYKRTGNANFKGRQEWRQEWRQSGPHEHAGQTTTSLSKACVCHQSCWSQQPISHHVTEGQPSASEEPLSPRPHTATRPNAAPHASPYILTAPPHLRRPLPALSASYCARRAPPSPSLSSE